MIVSHLLLPHIFSISCCPLTFCLSVIFSSHSAPQTKDSRESLPYEGEEKEVNISTCSSLQFTVCHVLWMCNVKRKERVNLALFVGKDEILLWFRNFCFFLNSIYLLFLHSGGALPPPPSVRYRDHKDIGAFTVHAAAHIDFLWGQWRNL